MKDGGRIGFERSPGSTAACSTMTWRCRWPSRHRAGSAGSSPRLGRDRPLDLRHPVRARPRPRQAQPAGRALHRPRQDHAPGGAGDRPAMAARMGRDQGGHVGALAKADSAKAPSTRTKAVNEAERLYRAFLDRLRAFRVLDPACGSGNFLNLALLALKDLEHRASIEAEAMGLHREFPQVGPDPCSASRSTPMRRNLLGCLSGSAKFSGCCATALRPPRTRS
jgi:hypothetical protein